MLLCLIVALAVSGCRINPSTSKTQSPPKSIAPVAAPTTQPEVVEDAADEAVEAGAAEPEEAPVTQESASREFTGSISAIDDATAARMSSSWRPGCPVPLGDLRLLTLSHHDYAGGVADGELVVHADHASDIVEVFRRLFDAEFPIERMELVDEYGADDDASMRANNTSAFNCREIATSPGVWSNHAYGAAIDINPLVNPWVVGDRVFPPEGTPYVDRSVPVQGGIYAGDAVTAAFADIGWTWGGDWSSSKDYQHFDKR